MLNGLFRARRRRSARGWHGVTRCLSLALLLPLPQLAAAQAPGKNEGQIESRPRRRPTQDDGDAPKAKKPAGPDAKAEDGDAADDDRANSTKIIPYEIFRDPKAEKLLDINNYPQYQQADRSRTATSKNSTAWRAGRSPIDLAVVNRVVDAMVSKLTDHANIQALIDPPPKLSPAAPANRAIQEATTALLEPIFLARGAVPRNQSFLTSYNRILSTKLTPLLKNHLIPRVQAMIVLGQSGSADLLPTYVAQIKEPNQTVWVKLWAFEGIVNAIEEGGAALRRESIADRQGRRRFPFESDDLPWPVQLRGLEALSCLEAGFRAESSRAGRDGQCRHEVPGRRRRQARSPVRGGQGARSHADHHGSSQVQFPAGRSFGRASGSRSWNADQLAHCPSASSRPAPERRRRPRRRQTGSQGSSKAKAKAKAANAPAAARPPRLAAPTPANPVKAKYLTALLIGPVYQAFEGVPGPRGDTGGLDPQRDRRRRRLTARRSSSWSNRSPRHRSS